MSRRIAGLSFNIKWLPLPKPVNLIRESERLKKKYGTISRQRDSDALKAARSILPRWTPGLDLSSLQLRGFVLLFENDDLSDEMERRVAAVLRENVGRLNFGYLLALWQRGGTGFEIANAPLESAVRDKVRRPNPKVPPWMVRPVRASSGNEIGDASVSGPTHRHEPLAFGEPSKTLARWIGTSDIPLADLDLHNQDIGVSTSIGIGEDALREAITAGPTSWWRKQRLQSILQWARPKNLKVQQAVAERALIEMGGNAIDLSALKARRTVETDALIAWVRSELGEPSASPGRWTNISVRARKIFEWFCLLDEFGRILDQFRQHAEDDRAQFWVKYLPALSDARFYMATDTAICMLRFDEYLIIEFGEVGNAAYIYLMSGEGISLRTARFEQGLRANDFKRLDQAPPVLRRLGCEGFEQRLLHQREWQHRAKDALGALGIVAR